MYVSSPFTAPDKKYSQVQREASAIVFTVKKFHKYLYGRRFELQTDQKPLILTAYDFSVSYVNTDSFGYVDVVSRVIVKHPRESEDVVIASIRTDEPQRYAIDVTKTLSIKLKDIKLAAQHCPVLDQVLKYAEKGLPRQNRQIKNPKAFFEVRDEVTNMEGFFLRRPDHRTQHSPGADFSRDARWTPWHRPNETTFE